MSYEYLNNNEEFEIKGNWKSSQREKTVLPWMRIINLPSFKGIEDGVSKTHLAVSIAIEAARHRYSKYFVNFYDLMPQLKKH